ncbi:Rossmann-like and DUF2520 domain-containing protein [Solitalea lacus]|uniref:Rossmann-like and DUF2520 domain-containing protein n=1 Tax=Solitalea lacus TaxID=2911172 RepID=UPI001EDA2DC4|nr:Rossmann-like and DUF2520 domain-containing protein [Solitalea lacus]UKJ09331.1 DUF2520 domain-containing protein [Solitalea lacus]
MKIVFLGSGNVATHLACTVQEAGHKVLQIFNHRLNGAVELAGKLNCAFTDKINEITDQADVYIISVKDDAIGIIAQQLNLKDKVVVHTAGSVDMNVLLPATPNVGVLYPLQTFSKDRALDFQSVPLFIEGANDITSETIKRLAQSIAHFVTVSNSEQRRILHLSAVFACNFVNHLYDLSNGLLKEHNLSFDALKPLILETAQKVQQLHPHNAQTGPARRNDQQVMTKHLQLLSNNQPLQFIYQLLSDSIVKSFQ